MNALAPAGEKHGKNLAIVENNLKTAGDHPEITHPNRWQSLRKRDGVKKKRNSVLTFRCCALHD
jgi:hypothetical protein